MHGYQLTFFTQQGRVHGMVNLAEWLLQQAKAVGIKGRLWQLLKEDTAGTANTIRSISLKWASSL